MITVIDGRSRGTTRLDWLDSKHTFSFGDYYNPGMMGFGPLRVINEDVVEPGKGFGSHQHSDMEIITYVCEGSLQHRDSMGTRGVISAGEVQHMSAGSGVMHSEFNQSSTDPVHFYQIWIMPDEKGIKPSYSQGKIEWRDNGWTLLAGPKQCSNNDAENNDAVDNDAALKINQLKINQNVELLGARIDKGNTLTYAPKRGSAWLQIARGEARIGDKLVASGDGVAVQDELSISISAVADVEVFLFDLPKA